MRACSSRRVSVETKCELETRSAVGEFVEKMGSRAKDAVILEKAFGQKCQAFAIDLSGESLPSCSIGFRVPWKGANG